LCSLFLIKLLMFLKAFVCDGFLLFLYKRCFFLISLLISVVIQGTSWFSLFSFLEYVFQ
jgi:hypothetical protein